jgi:hypothetical protein
MESAKTFKEWVRNLLVKEKMGVTTVDEQTGTPFELESEAIWDIAAATFSILYLLVMLIMFSWALFDIYYKQNQVLQYIFSADTKYPDSPLCCLIGYTVIGGGLGGVVNGLRSVVSWHAERRAFGWRFMWKYVTLPPLGAVLAAMVYALVYGGVTLLGGDFAVDQNSANQALSAFGIGALAGYGSHKVFKWLDEHVSRIFAITPKETNVPDLTGKSRAEAETALKKAGLTPGKVDHSKDSSASNIGKVTSQRPAPGSTVSRRKPVDITLGTEVEPKQP